MSFLTSLGQTLGILPTQKAEKIERPVTAFKNDQEYLDRVFPEFKDKNLTLADVHLADPSLTIGVEANLEDIVDSNSRENIQTLINNLPDGSTALSIIDVQKGFLDDGSLMVEGAQKKVLTYYEKLFIRNQELIESGNKPLFDVILMTKDFHPVGHKSFSRTFFDLYEITDETTGKKGFNLEANKEGKKLGITPRNWWLSLPFFASLFESPESDNKSTMTLYPKDDAPLTYDQIQEALINGSLMPFSKALHPIAVNEYMFSNIKNANHSEIVKDLKKINLLDDNGNINPEFELNGVLLNESFTVPNSFPPQTVFNEQFITGFKDSLTKENQDFAQEILNSLLEDLWPNHCVQETEDHQFNSTLVDLLERHAPKTPIIAMPKGDTLESGEAYSAGRNTKGDLPSPYGPILKALKDKIAINYVVGVATGYCPSGSAIDSSATFKTNTVYVKAGSKGITETDEDNAYVAMKANGVTVIEDMIVNPSWLCNIL